MNDLQKLESSIKSISDSETAICDINNHLLMAKFFGQHSKENTVPEMKEQDEKKVSPEVPFSPMLDLDKTLNLVNSEFNMWHSVGPIKSVDNKLTESDDESVHRTHSEQYLAAKVKIVYDLLSMLNTENSEEMSKKFLAMSSSPESSAAIRQSGCLPVLLQLIHGNGSNKTVRQQASQALHLIVQHNAENKQGRRESRVFRLIEQILEYCENVETREEENFVRDVGDNANVAPAVASLMKFSFDEEHRYAMCQFGALFALAKLIQTDYETHNGDVTSLNGDCVTVRRYACMALTNLTFGDSTNKALLCSLKLFMIALVAQLNSPNEDLCQVTASVIRNLAWRADSFIKQALREIDAVTMLTKTALRLGKESTLKAVSSALWNLSAHSSANKVDICNVNGALEYLVKMLNYQAPSGTLVVVENVGGILRNISKVIAIRDDYRSIIREHKCLYILLCQLKSPSLTVVTNACVTLWNLTARCHEDQCLLSQLGAVPMLRSLVHSKHKMISVGSSGALRNVLSARTETTQVDNDRAGTLAMRKRRALEQEIDARLRKTSDDAATVTTAAEPFDYSRSSEPPSLADRDKIYGGDTTMTAARSNDAKYNLFGGGEKTEEPSSVTGDDKGEKSDDVVKENSCYGSDSGDKGEELPGKTNGYCKIEEPYNVDDSFGDYAETDLDQPTNYSLRFGERQGSSDATRMIVDLERGCDDDIRASADAASPTSDDGKAATTTAAENASFETPLMFSRSSSLASVSSCDEPADDHGSVASEFSRAVSGVVSPSELPDSPTQTVPPSPRLLTPNASPAVTTTDGKSQSKIPLRRSVFEDAASVFADTVTVFKNENTPMQFSVATSLSSLLTFEDDSQKIVADSGSTSPSPPPPTTTNATQKTGPANLSSDTTSVTTKADPLEVDLSVEEQQAMLKACIDSGKPSAAPKRDKEKYTQPPPPTKRPNVMPGAEPNMIPDATINYCTEDTPISISHATSNSDLSLLCPLEDSFLQNSILPLSVCQDDQPDIELSTEEQEKLLNFCIAKGLQSLSHNSKSSFDGRKSSQSSTLSEITEDLTADDQTLLKDISEPGTLISISTCSVQENNLSFMRGLVNKELSEEDEKKLLNQCIALGMRSMKESSDLENIGPPSFLADANLDSSLTNVEEISDYPPDKYQKSKCTPKQKRHQIRDRYNTYTVKVSPTRSPPTICDSENMKKNYAVKEKRNNEKDRFKTRILSRGDFEEMAKCQDNVKTRSTEESPVPSSDGDANDFETYHENGRGAKIVKPVARVVRSGIPVVKSKQLPSSTPKTPLGSSGSTNSSHTIANIPCIELPVNLQRQNTFTKDEPSGIPLRKTSSKSHVKSNVSNENLVQAQFKSGIPSRIKEPSPKNSKYNATSPDDGGKSLDFGKNRWSISDNNIHATGVLKASSNTSLNVSPSYVHTTYTSKVSPSTSQSALPVRRESSGRNTYTYRK